METMVEGSCVDSAWGTDTCLTQTSSPQHRDPKFGNVEKDVSCIYIFIIQRRVGECGGS